MGVAMVTRSDMKQDTLDKENNKAPGKDKIPTRDKKSSKKTSKGEKKKSKSKRSKKKVQIDENTPYREKKTVNSGKISRSATAAKDVVDDAGEIKSDTISSQESGGSVILPSVATVPPVAEEGTENKEGTKEVRTKSHRKGKDPNNKKSPKRSSGGVSKTTDAKTSLTENSRDELTVLDDKNVADMKNKNLTPRGKGREKVAEPKVAQVVADEVKNQEKERAEKKVALSEHQLQIINTKKDKPKEHIKNLAMTQDEEQVKTKEDRKKVANGAKTHGKTSHGVARKNIAKTSLSTKASPRDGKAPNHVRRVVDSIKIDKIIPQNKEGKPVPILKSEVVHRSVQEEEEPEVTNGVTDEESFVSEDEEEPEVTKGVTDEESFVSEDEEDPEVTDGVPDEVDSEEEERPVLAEKKIDKKKTIHDDKTLNEGKEVNEEGNTHGQMKTESIIQRDEEDGESVSSGTTVLPAIPTVALHSKEGVAKGMTNEVDAPEKRWSNKQEPAHREQKLPKIKLKKDTDRIKTDNSNLHHKAGSSLPVLKENTVLTLNSPEPEEESGIDTEEEESGIDTEEEESDTDTEEEEESTLAEEAPIEHEPQKHINSRKGKPREERKTRTANVLTRGDEQDRRTIVANSQKQQHKEKTTLDKKTSKKIPHGETNNTDTKVSFDRKKKPKYDEKQNEKKLPLIDRTPGVVDSKILRGKRDRIKTKQDSEDAQRKRAELAEKRERAKQAEEELTRAEHALQIIKLRKELMDAIVVRNLKRLQAATELVQNKNYQSAMMDEMMRAKSLITRLQHIRKLWHAVLDLDHNTVAEVKGYVAPPPAVSKVLSATLLMLGHYVEETKEWPKVQNILNKTGTQSLLQRVARFDINEVDPGIAMGAKEILKDLSLEQVRVVSAGAATFYVWTKGLIKEIETRLGEDILNTRPKTRRPRNNWALSRPLAKFNKLSTLISVD